MQSGFPIFLKLVLNAIRSDKWPLLVFFLFVVLSLSLLASKGINGLDPISIILNAQLFMTCVVFWVGTQFLWLLFKNRPDSPVKFTRDFVSENLNFAIIAQQLPIIIALCMYMPIFSAMKSSISLFADYNWDVIFTHIDRLIHFGDAWQLVHPLVGYPFGTWMMSSFYNFWIVVIYAATVFFATRIQAPVLRHRFLLSYFLCWSFLGVAGAIGFASVGPAFVGPLLGQSHFDPLIAYLAEANSVYRIISVEVQAKLVNDFLEGYRGLGAGITAMPSMHVSMVFLFFLAFRHISTLAAWLSGAFFIIILIGSVHLAYHYAIDGYVSIIATAAIWHLSKLIYGQDGDNTKDCTNYRSGPI